MDENNDILSTAAEFIKGIINEINFKISIINFCFFRSFIFCIDSYEQ